MAGRSPRSTGRRARVAPDRGSRDVRAWLARNDFGAFRRHGSIVVWGVRKVASPAATSPLRLARLEGGEPVFDFVGPAETFIDDPNILSRWQMQLGVKHLFH